MTLLESLEQSQAKYSIQEANAKLLFTIQPDQEGETWPKYTVSQVTQEGVEKLWHPKLHELEGATITVKPNTEIILPEHQHYPVRSDQNIKVDRARLDTTEAAPKKEVTFRKGRHLWDLPVKTVSGKQGSVLSDDAFKVNPFVMIEFPGKSMCLRSFPERSHHKCYWAFEVDKDDSSYIPHTCDWEVVTISPTDWSDRKAHQTHSIRWKELKPEKTAPSTQLKSMSL